MKYCLIVPHYNHHRQLVEFLPKLEATGLVCIVVDDGSDESSRAQLESAIAAYPSIYFFAHPFNRGKGAAIKTALCHALHLGFTHGIQIDADGQHNPEDVQRFVARSESEPEQFICGRPVIDESVPKVRLYGRKITDFWVVVETLSLSIKDGLCGFRIYPLQRLQNILDEYYVGNRMDFDTEVLVKAIWHGSELTFIDTAVKYPEQGVSHFNYWRDNLQLVRLHLRLMLGLLPRVPLLIYRAINRR